MTNPFLFSGLIAAPHTPLDENGQVALDIIEAQVRCLRSQGVRGAFVCGTTGEGPSLTREERMAIAERWVASAGDDFAVIMQIGHSSLEEARLLARHAQAIGANAVAALPPFYFRPPSVEVLAACCREIAGSAPALPFFFYHIPSMTGVRLPMGELLEQVGDIPNFAGLKFTHDDLDEYAACVRFAHSRYQILFGRDEMLLDALRLGATGAVGSTYNFAARLYQRVITAFQSGDWETAQAAQTQASLLCRTLGEYGGLPAGKAWMNRQGVEVGPPRLPLRALTPDAQARLHDTLEPLDLTG